MFERFLLAAGLLAVAAAPAAAAGDPILAISGQPENSRPVQHEHHAHDRRHQVVLRGPLRLRQGLKVRNVLAESYETSPDGLVYTFKLREGVKFHDGTTFDAAAVKANLDRVLDPENHLARYNQFNRIKTIEVLSPTSLRITLKEPFGPFINSLAHASAAIISPTALKKYGKDIAFHPVGTGPFTFVDWKQTDTSRARSLPITGRPASEGRHHHVEAGARERHRAAMLQTGEADFAFPLPYEQAKMLESNKKLKIEVHASIIERYLSMNVLQKPFDDLRVRQAINYAINKEALAKVAFSGYAFPAQGIVPQGVLYATRWIRGPTIRPRRASS